MIECWFTGKRLITPLDTKPVDLASILVLGFTIAILLAIVGIILVIIDAARGSGGEEGKNVKYGGVVLIGPVPIIFGKDSEAVKWAVILTIVAVVVFVVLILLTYGVLV